MVVLTETGSDTYLPQRTQRAQRGEERGVLTAERQRRGGFAEGREGSRRGEERSIHHRDAESTEGINFEERRGEERSSEERRGVVRRGEEWRGVERSGEEQ